MAWGFFKKIKNAFKKAANWVHTKVIKPVVNTVKKVVTSDTFKSLVNTASKLAPAAGAAIATSQGAPPQAGMAAGTAFQNITKSLGYS